MLDIGNCGKVHDNRMVRSQQNSNKISRKRKNTAKKHLLFWQCLFSPPRAALSQSRYKFIDSELIFKLPLLKASVSWSRFPLCPCPHDSEPCLINDWQSGDKSNQFPNGPGPLQSLVTPGSATGKCLLGLPTIQGKTTSRLRQYAVRGPVGSQQY